jgi:hypothetical protein
MKQFSPSLPPRSCTVTCGNEAVHETVN